MSREVSWRTSEPPRSRRSPRDKTRQALENITVDGYSVLPHLWNPSSVEGDSSAYKQAVTKGDTIAVGFHIALRERLDDDFSSPYRSYDLWASKNHSDSPVNSPSCDDEFPLKLATSCAVASWCPALITFVVVQLCTHCAKRVHARVSEFFQGVFRDDHL